MPPEQNNVPLQSPLPPKFPFALAYFGTITVFIVGVILFILFAIIEDNYLGFIDYTYGIFLGPIIGILLSILYILFIKKHWNLKRNIWIAYALGIITVALCMFVLFLSINTVHDDPDRATKSRMASMRAVVEIYYGEHNSYGPIANSCDQPTSMFMTSELLKSSIGTVEESNKNKASCYSDGKSYSISIKFTSRKYWCVDSSGFSGYVDTQITKPACDNQATTTDQFADWKTYTSTQYGFEFKYPDNWSVFNSAYNDTYVLFGPGATDRGGDGGVEYIGDLKSGQSLQNFIKEFNQGVGGGSSSETPQVINGQNTIISIMPIPSLDQSDKTESKTVAFSNNGKVFQVYLNYHTNFTKYLSDKINLDIFNQILSTFKFIPLEKGN